ncbi:MAG: HK97 family phage prohead protease [Solirubrobacterales bacterium]
MSETIVQRPPRDGYRALAAHPAVRAAGDGGMPTLFGSLVRFNEPTEIDSAWEGHFIEVVAPGAAKKTLKENGKNIRILFNHGMDPSVGKRALTEPTFTEDDTEVEYSGPLFDTSYNRDLVPGLEAGQYGSSFRFRSVKETFEEKPGKSSTNPEGLPLRTIEEIEIAEGGPVTFPAYENAVAGVRSISDWVFLEGLRLDPTRGEELSEMFTNWMRLNPERVREILEAEKVEEPEGEETRAAIAYKKTATSDAAWDGPKTEASIPNDAGEAAMRQVFAWIDPAKDAAKKAAYRFVHHEWTDGKPGAANIRACLTGIEVCNGAMGGTTIPAGDVQGVYDHLAKHMKDAGKTAPPLSKRSAEDEKPSEHSDEPPEHSQSREKSRSDAPLFSAEDNPRRSDAPLFGVEDNGGKPTTSWRL